MQIQVQTHDVEHTDELEAFVREKVEEALEHFAEQLTRVEVHLSDENGPKGGADKSCRMEGRPKGLDPITVEHRSDNVHGAIREASGKLKRAIRHQLGRTGRRPGLS